MEDEKYVKNLYKMTNGLLSTKNGGTPQTFLINGKLIRRPVEMAKLQLTYYVEKLKKIMEKIPKTNKNPLRYLEKSFENWDKKNTVPIF